jgi:hypothetical protein
MEDYQTEAIAAAVATGGYCFIGHGGTSIHWENETGGETRLSTWGDAVKAACIAAGVPTVDITMVLVEKCYGISVRGPLIAITKLDLAKLGLGKIQARWVMRRSRPLPICGDRQGRR